MLIDDSLARQVIQPRPLDSHKGTFGRVLLIGGLYPYGGAIIMAASACVRSGAGLVTVATDAANIAALHSHLPEAMAIAADDQAALSRQLKAADAVLIGPGLGEEPQAQALLDAVLEGLSSRQILIADGSALNLLARQRPDSWPTDQLVLTPHQVEWARLSGLSIPEQSDSASQAALRSFPPETILVAKSHQTKIFANHGRLGRLAAGGPHQATGGMGDTLAGIIAGFAVQFRQVPLFERVAAAAYLHAATADELAREAYVVLPTQISAALPRLMKLLSAPAESADGP